MNRKLEKNKVNMVTDFVEKQETQRILTLHEDFEQENKEIQDVLPGKARNIMFAKHKTDIMREMLQIKNVINIDEISLHSSDGSDIISSTEKKLSELEEKMNIQLSKSSLALSKVTGRLNQTDESDYYQSNVKNEYRRKPNKDIIIESEEGQQFFSLRKTQGGSKQVSVT